VIASIAQGDQADIDAAVDAAIAPYPRGKRLAARAVHGICYALSRMVQRHGAPFRRA